MSKINTSVLNAATPILVVICGATATGKSGLALALAQRLETVILSADSRQVYREFDIGTAKPTAIEQQQAPHYLIDICDPTQTLTVADYQQQAQGLIARLRGKTESSTMSDGKNPSSSILLVGGTGLYIRSIVRGLKIPKVPPQSELRSQLQAIGQRQCYAILQQIDPIAAEKISPNDLVRTLRALEVFYVTGQPISQQQGENPPSYPILQIGLDCKDMDRLSGRIQQRTQQMIAAGLVAEVERLIEKYGTDLPLLNTLGYQEVKQHLSGKLLLEAAIEQTVLHTRQFAKRQRTWFRADSAIEWFDADDSNLIDRVWERIRDFIRTYAGG